MVFFFQYTYKKKWAVSLVHLKLYRFYPLTPYSNFFFWEWSLYFTNTYSARTYVFLECSAKQSTMSFKCSIYCYINDINNTRLNNLSKLDTRQPRGPTTHFGSLILRPKYPFFGCVFFVFAEMRQRDHHGQVFPGGQWKTEMRQMLNFILKQIFSTFLINMTVFSEVFIFFLWFHT